MDQFETALELSVHTDLDYKYVVEYSVTQIAVSYVETINVPGKPDNNTSVTFVSIDEMEAVAKAMLAAVKFARDAS